MSAESNPATGVTTKRVGLAMVVVGALVLIACVATIAIRIGPAVVNGITGRSYATPMDQVVTLSHGKWVVFERTGSQSGGGGVTFTQNGAVTLSPDDVEVTDPDGNPVVTSFTTSNETINRNGAIYTGAVSFEANVHGDYRVRISATGDQVLLSRDLGSLFGSVLGFFLTAVGAGLLLVAGIVVLIVSATRRRRRRPTLPPPGWYPNPQVPGQVLWWNGQQWAG